MENKLKYFLIVAEELNISRAAEKVFITQQSMSTHIKRLEQELHTALFNRGPRLSLTQDGKMLVETLQQIKMLEDNYTDRLTNGKQAYRGVLNIGIAHSRASIIMPKIIPQYKKIWPNIDIILQYDNTFENMENRLLRGYLDIFVGISKISNGESIAVVPLKDEKVYIVISKNLIEKYLLSQDLDCISDLCDNVDLPCFKDVPFILNTETELSCKIYSEYFENHGLHLQPVVSSDDAWLRTYLCANDIGAAVMVEQMLIHVINHNQKSKDNPLYYFPVAGLTVPSFLAYNRRKFLTEYARDFINMVQEASQIQA